MKMRILEKVALNLANHTIYTSLMCSCFTLHFPHLIIIGLILSVTDLGLCNVGPRDHGPYCLLVVSIPEHDFGRRNEIM